MARSITQNANHTMRQLAITDTIFSNQNQTCNFGYDEFTRLTSANCGSVWGADYAYDVFGNMNKTTISGSIGSSFAQVVSGVKKTSNRSNKSWGIVCRWRQIARATSRMISGWKSGGGRAETYPPKEKPAGNTSRG